MLAGTINTHARPALSRSLASIESKSRARLVRVTREPRAVKGARATIVLAASSSAPAPRRSVIAHAVSRRPTVMYITKLKDAALSVQFLALSAFTVLAYTIVAATNYELFAKIMPTLVNAGMTASNWPIFKAWIITAQLGWFAGKITAVRGGASQVKKFCALNVFPMAVLGRDGIRRRRLGRPGLGRLHRGVRVLWIRRKVMAIAVIPIDRFRLASRPPWSAVRRALSAQLLYAISV